MIGKRGIEIPDNSGNWDTPDEFFEACARQWGPFDLDVAADESNKRAPMYFDKEADGLKSDWGTANVWANPPYLRSTLRDWVMKAIDHGEAGGRVVMLLPGRIDVKWFHEACARDATFLILKGRLSFADMGPARWPSILLVAGHGYEPGIYPWAWKQSKARSK